MIIIRRRRPEPVQSVAPSLVSIIGDALAQAEVNIAANRPEGAEFVSFEEQPPSSMLPPAPVLDALLDEAIRILGAPIAGINAAFEPLVAVARSILQLVRLATPALTTISQAAGLATMPPTTPRRPVWPNRAPAPVAPLGDFPTPVWTPPAAPPVDGGG